MVSVNVVAVCFARERRMYKYLPKINIKPTATAVLVLEKNVLSKKLKLIKQLPHMNKYRNKITGECNVKKLMLA